MNKLIKIILIFLLTIEVTILNAQDKKNNVAELSIEEGLTHEIINCIFQDSKGFLWIGTENGLNKYDGYSFSVFKHNPSDTTSISNNYIKCIVEDINSNLWIGTKRGLNKLNRADHTFTNFLHNPSSKNCISHNNIEGMLVDHLNFIWLKTNNSLDRFNPDNHLVENFEYFIDNFSSTSDNHFFDIIEDYKGLIWFGTKDGLNVFDIITKQTKRYCHEFANPKSLSDNYITSILEDIDHNLLIGTNNGLNIFNRRLNTFEIFVPNTADEQKIIEIYEDHSGNIWVGTNKRIVYFDKEQKLFLPKLTDKFIDLSYLAGIEMTSIMQDYSNIFWLGIKGHGMAGLLKLDGNRKKIWNLYQPFLNTDESYSHDISSIIAYQSSIYIGTKGNGLCLYNHQNSKSIYLTTSNSNLTGDFINCLYPDYSKLWIGTNQGISILNIKELKFSSLSDEFTYLKSNVLKDNIIRSIIRHSSGDFYIGTNNGLFVFRSNDYKMLIHNSNNDDNCLIDNNIQSLLEDNKKCVWIGTNNGLDVYDPINDTFRHYRKEYNSKKSLSDSYIFVVFQDSRGIIWVGTESGLNRYNPDIDQFEFFTQKDGFYNDCILSIVEDDNGDLWLSTKKGLSKFNFDESHITNFDMKDGLLSFEFNKGASSKSESGELFFGGVKGINMFVPDSIVMNKFVPKLSLTSIEYVTKDGVHKRILDQANQLIIEPSVYSFTLEFSALEYNRPERNNYKYMLEGFDKSWIEIGAKHFATYSKIPPGTYQFHVKGSNNDLIWNNEGINVQIVVKPSLFNSKLSYGIYVTIILLAIFLLIQYRTKNLIATNQILKEKEKASLEIAMQKEELAIKDKNNTDSLNYAQRIIKAMMPTMRVFKRIFPESFVLFHPKEIVSGDFFWIAEQGDKVFFAAVDCTGHGIPGAFMSIIGVDLLRNIIEVLGIEQPAEILNELNKGIANTFRDAEDMTVTDGMDLAFCVLDRKRMIIEYAGAFNPLYLVRDNNIVEYNADRFSVGMAKESRHQTFSNHEIELQPHDVIYLFTDGYADQFGGPKGKKYKFRRFRHLLLTIHNLSMEQQEKSLRDSYMAWKGLREQVDDILIIGIRPY